MPGDHAELIEEILETYKVTMKCIGLTALASEWINLDLSMAQMKALFALAGDESITISDVADRLGIGISAASHLVERLVQLKLVTRAEDPADRRRTYALLCPTGRDLVARFQQVNRERMRALLIQMHDDDLKALLTGLRALAAVAAPHREAILAGADST